VTGALPLGPIAALVADVVLHALRLLPVVSFSPLLGGPLLPPPARAALALVLGAAVRSASGGGALAAPSALSLAGAAAGELAIGAGLAAVASLPVEAARGAGRLVDTLRGATLGELHVAPVRQQETAVGDLLVHWTLALSAWAGADRLLVSALVGSFRALPVGAPLPAGDLLAAGATAATELLASALCIGAPAAGGILVAEAALALATRLAPRAGLADGAPAARALLGLSAVALASSAVGARLVQLVALSAGLADGIGAAPGSRGAP
jgi:type III secretory pathway component EscT